MSDVILKTGDVVYTKMIPNSKLVQEVTLVFNDKGEAVGEEIETIGILEYERRERETMRAKE